jgi:hypothetical protein
MIVIILWYSGGQILLEPVQLPSGKIVDLGKCLAIVPSSTSPDSELVLSGIEHHIPIEPLDLEFLRQQIVANNAEKVQGIVSSENDRDKAKRIQEFNLIWNELAADDRAEEELGILQQILDEERPIGQKLYS